MSTVRCAVTNHELKRMQRMAACGCVSLAEASRALNREPFVVYYWAQKLGLRFPDGRQPLIWRLATRRRRG